MKKFALIFTLVLAFIACSKTDDQTNIELPFGIQYDDYSLSNNASGFIMFQNYGGPRLDLTVDTAYMMDLDSASIYLLNYQFINKNGVISDSLRLFLKQKTTDQNYHSHTDDSQNKIMLAIFNLDTLMLDSSALQVAPIDSNQTLHTVLNLHTADSSGTFNGTVDFVPLVLKK